MSKGMVELEKLGKETRAAESCLEILEAGSKRLDEHSAHVFRDNYGDERSQLVCSAASSRPSHFLRNNLGRGARMTLGRFSDTALQELVKTPTSPTSRQVPHMAGASFPPLYNLCLLVIGCHFTAFVSRLY